MAATNSLKSLNRQSDKVSKSDLFKVSPELLIEEEGFNPRGAFIDGYFEQPEVQEHIRRLADAYKRGDYVPPIVVVVRDGQVFIRDGHCRYRAIHLALSEGADIRKVEVLEIKGDEAAQTALILRSNDGLKLSPLERAVVYGTRIKWGWSAKEIAEEFGRTEPHVKQLLDMLDMPLELKRMVQHKTLSAYAALDLFQEHGEDAVEMVKEAVDKKEGQGEKPKKVTPKDVGPKKPRIPKKVVSAMHSSISTITQRLDSFRATDDGENYTLTISKDEFEELRELREKLVKIEAGNEKAPQ
jgi:ParB family transcriptional regulator, chromosome partitioning protein